MTQPDNFVYFKNMPNQQLRNLAQKTTSKLKKNDKTFKKEADKESKLKKEKESEEKLKKE